MAAIDNPFAILSAVVAPAVLTNACSVLSLGTANRVARVVDRTRAIATQMATFQKGQPEHIHCTEQLDRLEMRGELLVRALRLFYTAIGSFSASALVAVVGSAFTVWNLDFAFHAAAAVGMLIGATAVGCLVTGCFFMVKEARLAIHNMVASAKLHVGIPPESEM